MNVEVLKHIFSALIEEQRINHSVFVVHHIRILDNYIMSRTGYLLVANKVKNPRSSTTGMIVLARENRNYLFLYMTSFGSEPPLP